MPFCVIVGSSLVQASSNSDGSSALNQVPAIGLISAWVTGSCAGFMRLSPSSACCAMACASRHGLMLARLAITTTVSPTLGKRSSSVR